MRVFPLVSFFCTKRETIALRLFFWDLEYSFCLGRLLLLSSRVEKKPLLHDIWRTPAPIP